MHLMFTKISMNSNSCISNNICPHCTRSAPTMPCIPLVVNYIVTVKLAIVRNGGAAGDWLGS